MRLEFRLLFLPVLAILSLAACTSETDNHTSKNDSDSRKDIYVAAQEANENLKTEELNKIEEATTEETATEETATEETENEPETEDTKETKAVVEAAAPEAAEALHPDVEPIVEQLLEETDIELENHLLIFTEMDEYIEIDVRETIDEDTTVAAGLYRYMYETDEIFVSDYLTGEFIPLKHLP